VLVVGGKCSVGRMPHLCAFPSFFVGLVEVPISKANGVIAAEVCS